MEGVRPAVAGDRPRLVTLYDELVEQTSVPRAAGRFNNPRAGLDDGEVMVATFDEYVAGFALLATDGDTGVIAEIYVDPPFRENGLGELLVDAAVQWARSKQLKGIEMNALPGDRSSKNLAERSGFRARQITLYRAL